MTLIVANKNISREMSPADFDRQVLITWGKNVREEMVPAV
jgi:hypothetical protein